MTPTRCMTLSLLVAACCAVCCTASAMLRGQASTSGELTGNVADFTGAVIPGATLVLSKLLMSLAET